MSRLVDAMHSLAVIQVSLNTGGIDDFKGFPKYQTNSMGDPLSAGEVV